MIFYDVFKGFFDRRTYLCGRSAFDRFNKNDPCTNSCAFCVLGRSLGGLGIYQKLIDFAGAGATVPLTGFGNALAEGVREAIRKDGFLGVITGGFQACAAGVTVAMLSGLAVALVCRPKDK